MEWYDNIFDVMDDGDDTTEYTSEELNRYYSSGHFQLNPNEWDEEEQIEEINEHTAQLFSDEHTFYSKVNRSIFATKYTYKCYTVVIFSQ